MGDERPWTVPNLALRWACSEGLIRKMIEKGELRSFRLGVLIRIPADEVARIECQNPTLSSVSEEGSHLSTETPRERAGDERSMPLIGRARNPRPALSGKVLTIHHGRLAG